MNRHPIEAAPLTAQNGKPSPLTARRLGIESQHEAQIYMRKDCHVCKSEGFAAHARVVVTHQDRSVEANLYQVTSDILGLGEAGLSEAAWNRLGLQDGDEVFISHPPPLESLSAVRGKVYGRDLDFRALSAIIADIEAGRYSSIQLSAFITACALNPNRDEASIAATIRKSSATAMPNVMLIGHADRILGRNGRMIGAVEALGVHHGLDRVGDELAGGQAVEHALVPHGDAVADGNGHELEGEAPGLAHALLGLLGLGQRELHRPHGQLRQQHGVGLRVRCQWRRFRHLRHLHLRL